MSAADTPIRNVGGFGFGAALMALEDGAKVAREGWNGKGLWIEQQNPDAGSKMTQSYLFLNNPPCDAYPQGARVPWAPSQTDVLARDWRYVD